MKKLVIILVLFIPLLCSAQKRDILIMGALSTAHGINYLSNHTENSFYVNVALTGAILTYPAITYTKESLNMLGGYLIVFGSITAVKSKEPEQKIVGVMLAATGVYTVLQPKDNNRYNLQLTGTGFSFKYKLCKK